MHHSSHCGRFFTALLWLFVIAGTGQVRAQDEPEKAIIALFDLQGIRTEPTTAIAASDRLREEVLKTGHFKLLSRNTLDKKLGGQGLNQLTCLESDCALKVGKVLGARLVLTGKIIIIDSSAWQVSAEIIDVATGETVVADSIIYEGNLVGLISKGIPQVVDKLIPAGDPASYADIVAFLQQRKSTPSIAAESGAGERLDDPLEKKPPHKLKWPFELQAYRIWGSPISTYAWRFRDFDVGTLETFEGRGSSAGFEAQSTKAIAAGVTIYTGSLETLSSPISGNDAEQPISGDYQAIHLLIMGGFPLERPWVFVGSGLGYMSVDWNVAGVTGSDTLTSILFMARLAYTFDFGLMLGFDYQQSFLDFPAGDRHDSIKGQGIGDLRADVSFNSLFMGYSF